MTGVQTCALPIWRDFQVTGGPNWVGAPYYDSSGVRVWPAAEVFEIHAMAQRPVNEAEMQQRIRDLLAVLFKLALHRETRPLPIYALVAGPQGPNLPPAIEPAPCPVPAGECGFPTIGGPEGGVHSIMARGATMSGFASLLTNNVDRPVVDKTGLTAGYSFDLPYEHSGPGWRVGSAIFSAIQTLGLRLEPQTETMEVVVIDAAERLVPEIDTADLLIDLSENADESTVSFWITERTPGGNGTIESLRLAADDRPGDFRLLQIGRAHV